MSLIGAKYQLGWLVLAAAAVLRLPAEEAGNRFEFLEPQMGVPFRIILYAPDEEAARAAAGAAFVRVAELNDIMSDYQTDSELSQLSYGSDSQPGKAVRISDDLWNVLSLSQKIARDSGGAFDVTVGPCSALWRKARREKEMPEAWRIEHFQARVGYTNLVLDPEERTATLLKPNMRLDLGGIAKGYAADEALRVLRSRGLGRALVAASGDLAIGDPPPGETGWDVEIIGSDIPGARPSLRAILSNAGVATSGDLSQRLEINGVRYSHILNPFTCVGMTNQALTTVIAPNCTLADPLATTLSILEPGAALDLAEEYGVAVRTIRLDEGEPHVYANEPFREIAQAKPSEEQ